MKTILILGAGVMQVPAIRIAKGLGWRTIVVDGNPQAQARDMADQFEQVDLKDREGLLSVGRRLQADSGIDGVFTAGTDFSSSVAWVSERLGLPGIRFDAAMRATDKCLMREAFSRAGVPSPRFACWTGQGDPADLLRGEGSGDQDGLGLPLVVKPVDNMGARGVRRVESADALADACRAAITLSRSSRVIVEQFMEGRELSLDAIVYRGSITICGVADRIIRFPPNFVEMGHTMPTDLDRQTVAEVERVFSAGIRALGIDNGAAKGDIKVTPKGVMIGEIAARLSGGYMSGWTFPLAYGVQVTEGALRVAVGMDPGDLSPRWSRVCAERAVISLPGEVASLTGVEEAKRVPGVSDVFLRTAEGQRVVFPTNNVEKCGNVISVGETREEAERSARRGIAAIHLYLKPLVAETTTHLFRARTARRVRGCWGRCAKAPSDVGSLPRQPRRFGSGRPDPGAPASGSIHRRGLTTGMAFPSRKPSLLPSMAAAGFCQAAPRTLLSRWAASSGALSCGEARRGRSTSWTAFERRPARESSSNSWEVYEARGARSRRSPPHPSDGQRPSRGS